MSFLQGYYFWLFLFLLAGYLKGDFKKITATSFGYILTFIFIVLALSRPVITQKVVTDREYLGDVVLALDISYSMNATDIKPTRAQKAQMIFLKLINKKSNRYAIVAFTTNAIILSPMTQDSEILEHTLNSLDRKSIITKGSAIMPVLKLARKVSKADNLRVVILTDGGDTSSYEKEALFAKENDMIVNIFMLATQTGSTLKLSNGELLKDSNSNIVVSRENKAIKEIADMTGGIYTKEFSELLDALDRQFDKSVYTKVSKVKNIELFYLFVFLAIVSFLFSVTTLKRYYVIALLLFGISLDASTLHDANKFYRDAKYEDALVIYKSLKSSDKYIKSVIFYNMGNTFVRLKRFKEAREAYKKSLVLYYSKDTYENLMHIMFADEQKEMANSKHNKSKKISHSQKDEKRNKKEAGGSNMNVSALSGSSDDKGIKRKNVSSSSVGFNTHKAKLSSKQYELINKRVVNEKKPW